MDRVSTATRSRVMAAVRSRGTRLECAFGAALRAAGLRGFRRNVASLPGRPDFVMHAGRLAIFVDSCFWHGCRAHLRMPASRLSYWRAKIKRNLKRDRQVRRQLTRSGWQVIRVWEHQVTVPSRLCRVLEKIRRALDTAPDSRFVRGRSSGQAAAKPQAKISGRRGK